MVCTDTLVEGLHFIGDELAADLAFKLLAVNASDLAAMNARPTHALLNLSLPGARFDAAWRAGFMDGLGEACAAFGLQLLGGDTTGSPAGLVLSATVTWKGARPGGVQVQKRPAGLRLRPVGAGALGPPTCRQAKPTGLCRALPTPTPGSTCWACPVSQPAPISQTADRRSGPHLPRQRCGGRGRPVGRATR